MSREDIVAVASRLFAVCLLVSCIRFAAGAISTDEPYALLVISCVPLLAIAAVLWFFPLTVARRLLPVMKESRPCVDPASRTALELGLTLIGFWILSRALIDLLYWIVLIAQMHRAQVPLELTMDQVANAVATVAEIALGFWLLLGSRGVINLFHRIRYGSTRVAPDDRP